MSESNEGSRAPWPQIGDIVPNHDGGRPAASEYFTGSHYALGGDVQAIVAFTRDRCRCQQGDRSLDLEYQAFLIRTNLYLVDAISVTGEPLSLSMVFDLAAQRVLIVEVRFPSPTEAQQPVLARLAASGSQSAVKVRYLQAAIGDSGAAPFARTSALIGQSLRYSYSSTHVYDHLYLTERFYAWLCRQGPDEGLGDFEECDYFELGPELFLVSWREKLLPCVGILAEDHAAMRATGKIAGVDAYTGKLDNTRVGATIRRIADSPQSAGAGKAAGI